MPLVEVLTTSKSHTTPGWAYVPDTSYGSSSQTTKASGRKRGIREPGGRTTNLTSRQNHAIIRHLAELDRENHRENVHIAVPARKDTAPRVDHGRPARAKMTSNVRRILQSQKTFKNHLDDEEAALAHQASIGVMGRGAGVGGGGGGAVVSTPAVVAGTPGSKVAKVSAGRSVTPITAKPAPPVEAPVSDRQKRARTRKSLSTVTPATETETGKETEQQETAAPKQKEEEKETDTADGDAMQIDTDVAEPAPIIKGLIKTAYDNDPLLKTHLPRAPSHRLMAALLSEPALTYNAARARPSATGKPARYFCTICGYWGKIKCRNCGVRTCGLDCYKVHEDSRCGAFF